jgi:undecaprenyl-diphosphatase
MGVGLLSCAAILGMVTTTEGVAEQDGPVLGWLSSHRHPSVTLLLEFVSSSTVTVLVPAAVLIATLMVAVTRGAWRPVATVLLTFGAASGISLALKVSIQRARPSTAVMLGTPASGWSFPSGHTLLTSALMGALVMLVWRRTSKVIVRVVAATGAVAGALLMGVSRLYLGDHWLTDVLASYALAVSSLAVTAVLLNARHWSDGPAAPPTQPGLSRGSQSRDVASAPTGAATPAERSGVIVVPAVPLRTAAASVRAPIDDG